MSEIMLWKGDCKRSTPNQELVKALSEVLTYCSMITITIHWGVFRYRVRLLGIRARDTSQATWIQSKSQAQPDDPFKGKFDSLVNSEALIIQGRCLEIDPEIYATKTITVNLVAKQ
jgi:hypothetical protein